ncbi:MULTISPECIES: hypothetical protein [unclassified Variovorax]|uniref:hypothetical protein n=1 Tax=unclassified Variovorax TaxID=663243 RepID=UPI00257573DA|nr:MULTISPECIES: hypothetical protein [unclassified Variovorax]MDM0086769.1 hypothetical protein [Variovorax sp. J22G40]MDM0144975.1 hypothetical protein [Variovorax sp. J2P1-31]
MSTVASHRPVNVDVWHLVGEQGTGKSIYAQQFAKTLLKKTDLRALEVDAWDLEDQYHGRIDLLLEDFGLARVVMISHALPGAPGIRLTVPHRMKDDRVVHFTLPAGIDALRARAIWDTREFVSSRCAGGVAQ